MSDQPTDEPVAPPPPGPHLGDADEGCAITTVHFHYRNWRGEESRRSVLPIRTYYGSTDWHPEPRWLLEAYDLDRQGVRTFSLDDAVFENPLALAYYFSAVAQREQRNNHEDALDARKEAAVLAERQRCLRHLGSLVRTPGGLVMPTQVLHALELIRSGQ